MRPGKRDKLRLEMFAEQGGRCAYCTAAMDLALGKSDENRVSFEHIIQQSRNGPSEPFNLVLAHQLCNTMACGAPPNAKIRVLQAQGVVTFDAERLARLRALVPTPRRNRWNSKASQRRWRAVPWAASAQAAVQ